MTIRTIDMTDHEYELYRQFIREYDQKNSPRQPLPMDLMCPKCGGGDLVYLEDISCARDIERISDDGTITINGRYTTSNFDDCGTNPRILCRACDVEYAIPEEAELDFV